MPWQMLLPHDIVVDVKTTEDVITSVKYGGRCYCHEVNVADVPQYHMAITSAKAYHLPTQ